MVLMLSRCSENEPAILPSGIGEDRDSIQKRNKNVNHLRV